MSNIVMKDSEVTLLQFSGLVGTLVPHYLTTSIPIKQTMVCFLKVKEFLGKFHVQFKSVMC